VTWPRRVRLRVEVEDDIIVVTLPGTSLRVIYGKTKYSQLVTVDFRGDKDAGIPLADFLARAWPVANDKARELGWLV
jgi:hypothetical protein